MTLLILTRRVMGLERYITVRHLEAMAKIMLLTGSIVGFCYLTEFFLAWYGGNPYERAAFLNRATGPYAWAYWTMVTCNALRAAAAVVAAAAHLGAGAVRALAARQRRHVVRALRHHRHLAPPRLPAVELGDVPADAASRWAS